MCIAAMRIDDSNLAWSPSTLDLRAQGANTATLNIKSCIRFEKVVLRMSSKHRAYPAGIQPTQQAHSLPSGQSSLPSRHTAYPKIPQRSHSTKISLYNTIYSPTIYRYSPVGTQYSTVYNLQSRPPPRHRGEMFRV